MEKSLYNRRNIKHKAEMQTILPSCNGKYNYLLVMENIKDNKSFLNINKTLTHPPPEKGGQIRHLQTG
jgi:hypothetical protein